MTRLEAFAESLTREMLEAAQVVGLFTPDEETAARAVAVRRLREFVSSREYVNDPALLENYLDEPTP